MLSILKLILGSGFILSGIVLGLYLGFWVCFIGGIIQIIEAIKINPVNSVSLALGIGKIICSGVIGWLSFITCSVIGSVILGE